MTGVQPLESEERRALRDAVARFTDERIAPIVAGDDLARKFRREIFDGMAELGITGITTAAEWGGAGLGFREYAIVMEEIARVSVPYAVVLAVTGLPQQILRGNGSDEQKERWLKPLATGKLLGAFALTEPAVGSDAANLRTTAVEKNGKWILDGQKTFITSAGHADVYAVFARTGGKGARGISCFLVEKGDKGFSVGPQEKKMGWHSSPLAPLYFDGVTLPADRLLGKAGDGFKYAMAALDSGRITIAACAVGLMRGALDASLKYAKEREAFGKPIADQPVVQSILADMDIAAQASMQLVEHAAALRDEGHAYGRASAIAKCFATDAAMRVTTDAVQVFGGYGYLQDHPVERMMRDAKVMQIVEGTNQIQRLVIARDLLKG